MKQVDVWSPGACLLLSQKIEVAPVERAGSIPTANFGNRQSVASDWSHASYLEAASYCTPTTLSHRFRDIVRKHGMPDIRLHDLRHCCARGMAAIGIPREIRERVQNQVTGRRTSIGARYDQHEYIAKKRAALERWQAILALQP